MLLQTPLHMDPRSSVLDGSRPAFATAPSRHAILSRPFLPDALSRGLRELHRLGNGDREYSLRQGWTTQLVNFGKDSAFFESATRHAGSPSKCVALRRRAN